MRTVLFVCVGLALGGPPAHAAGDPLLIVPAGVGDGLEVTASIARELALKLRAQRTAGVELAYPLGRPAYVPSRRARQAQRQLQQAKRAYRLLELDQVRKVAQKALQLCKREIKRGGSPRTYVEALHYLAAADTVDGREVDGFKWMSDAYLFDRRPPDTKIFDPKVQSMHAKVAGSDDHTGMLAFRVEPGALVWLNNTLYGAARGKAQLRAGLYLVRIGRPGYLTYEKWLRVHPGKTREVAIKLQPSPAPEPPTIVQLRKELDAAPGTATTMLATDFGSAEVLVVGAAPSCTRSRCTVKLRWAKGDQWIQRRDVTTSDGPHQVALLLLESGGRQKAPHKAVPDAALQLQAAAQCVDDAQCLSDQRCIDGRCKSVVPVTRKWWFWTIVGVVAAGAGVTAAVLLTRPDAQVLEVR